MSRRVGAEPALGPRLPELADTAGPLRVRRAWPDRGHPDRGHPDVGRSEGSHPEESCPAGPRGRGLVVEAAGTDGRVVAAVAGPHGARILATDPALPPLDDWRGRPGCRVVAHRGGKRAVLAVGGGQGAPDRFVKVARPRAAARAAQRHEAVAGLLAGVPGAPRLPRLLAHDRRAGVVELSALPGVDLRDWVLAQRPTRGVEAGADAGRAVGRVLVALAVVGDAPGLPRHDLDDEREATRRWVDDALDHGVVRGPWRQRLRDAWDEAGERLAALDASPRPVLAHRDLHDGQLLVAVGPAARPPGDRLGGAGGGEVVAGLLDLDTAAVADPALDLANLLAHLDLLRAAHPRPAVAATVAGVERGLGEVLRRDRHPGLGQDPARLATLRAVSRVRLAAVHAFRPAAGTLVPALLGARPTGE